MHNCWKDDRNKHMTLKVTMLLSSEVSFPTAHMWHHATAEVFFVLQLIIYASNLLYKTELLTENLFSTADCRKILNLHVFTYIVLSSF